jgi:hypothetical protein
VQGQSDVPSRHVHMAPCACSVACRSSVHLDLAPDPKVWLSRAQCWYWITCDHLLVTRITALWMSSARRECQSEGTGQQCRASTVTSAMPCTLLIEHKLYKRCAYRFSMNLNTKLENHRVQKLVHHPLLQLQDQKNLISQSLLRWPAVCHLNHA